MTPVSEPPSSGWPGDPRLATCSDTTTGKRACRAQVIFPEFEISRMSAAGETVGSSLLVSSTRNCRE